MNMKTHTHTHTQACHHQFKLLCMFRVNNEYDYRIKRLNMPCSIWKLAFIEEVGVRCSSMVERWLTMQCIIETIVDPLSNFWFQPVLHNWCNKSHGRYYPVCGMVHTKDPLLLTGKSSLCSGRSRFPLFLSEWSCTISLMPQICKCVHSIIK